MTDQSPTSQTRQRTVFHRDSIADDEGLTAFRAPLTDDRPDVYRMLDLSTDVYDDMGRPDVITVTVEPGDLLNVPEREPVAMGDRHLPRASVVTLPDGSTYLALDSVEEGIYLPILDLDTRQTGAGWIGDHAAEDARPLILADPSDPTLTERINDALNLAQRRSWDTRNDGPRPTTVQVILDALTREPAPRLPEPTALATVYREPNGEGWMLNPQPRDGRPDESPWKALDNGRGIAWKDLETGGRITSPGEADEQELDDADLAVNAAGAAQIADNATLGDVMAHFMRGARESARLTSEAALTPCTDDAPCTACQNAPQTAVAETPEPTLLAAVIEDADGYVLIRQTSLPEPERAPWRRATTDPSEAMYWYADLPQPVTVLDAGIDLSEPVCGESCDGTCDEPEGEEPSIGAMLAEVAANALTIAAMKGITALTETLLPEPEEETGETCEDPDCCQQDEEEDVTFDLPEPSRIAGLIADLVSDTLAPLLGMTFAPNLSELDDDAPTTEDRPADRITPAQATLDETLDKVKAAMSEPEACPMGVVGCPDSFGGCSEVAAMLAEANTPIEPHEPFTDGPACPHNRPGCKGGADCLTLAEYLSDAASPMVTNVFVAHEPTGQDLAQTIANAMAKGPTARTARNA